MGIFDGCLLASDIDGTLLASGYLPQRNIEAVEYFLSEGGAFSLATGRSVGAVSMVTDKIKGISPSIVCNGAVIYDYSAKKTRYGVSLSEEDKFVVGAVLERFSGIGIELHSGEEVYALSRSRSTDLHQSYEKLEAVDIDLASAVALPWNKTLIAPDNKAQQDEVLKFLSTLSFSCDVVNTTAEIDGETQYYCELLPKGVTKASALVKLKELLGIKEGCCFAIGDYYNDLAMLKAADVSAVPAEAPSDIKAVADTVVGSVREGAVADFIEYINQRLSQSR